MALGVVSKAVRWALLWWSLNSSLVVARAKSHCSPEAGQCGASGQDASTSAEVNQQIGEDAEEFLLEASYAETLELEVSFLQTGTRLEQSAAAAAARLSSHANKSNPSWEVSTTNMFRDGAVAQDSPATNMSARAALKETSAIMVDSRRRTPVASSPRRRAPVASSPRRRVSSIIHRRRVVSNPRPSPVVNTIHRRRVESIPHSRGPYYDRRRYGYGPVYGPGHGYGPGDWRDDSGEHYHYDSHTTTHVGPVTGIIIVIIFFSVFFLIVAIVVRS